MTTTLLVIALATIFVAAETTWSENLVLADCGIGLGPNGGSTSREMMYYSAAAWGAPQYIKNVPWDGSYPWRGSGVIQTLPNGDKWSVYIDNKAGDPNFAGWALHTYDSNALTCWSRHLDGLFTLADGKKCSMAYICNHQSPPKPAPAPAPPAPSSGSLDENATSGALKYQPVIDFDQSACYNTAAITRDGHCNEGLELGQGDCRQLNRLHGGNTYVREKCTNDGWCFYLYGYYFEKDEGGSLASGHKHDWEHLVVWTLNSEARYLAWSAHGNYYVNKPNAVEWQGNNPKFVVHRDRGTTHAFRRSDRNEPPENALGKWIRSPLVSLERTNKILKDKMLTHDWGHAHPDLTDERFDKAYWSTWTSAKALDNSLPPRPDPIPPPQ
ncbi:hypothetical protein OPT61_g7275 [Boeremia exigua]|uniref:Uncharacterized protein n=1 Tax=Boeremia exigua TaxID=749465 RepID=A0ACC2I2X3_9PLEO|nr:hypothetical protein OPT61_g7275 [Boeremia exigua]